MPKTPFDSTTAKQAGALGLQARKANIRARAARRAEIDLLLDERPRDLFGPVLLAAAFKLAEACVTGEIETPTTELGRLRLAETARILQQMGRLEAGEATSHTVIGHVDLDALKQRVEALDVASRPAAP